MAEFLVSLIAANANQVQLNVVVEDTAPRVAIAFQMVNGTDRPIHMLLRSSKKTHHVNLPPHKEDHQKPINPPLDLDDPALVVSLTG